MKKAAAVLLALLLTGALVFFCVSFIGRQVILPAMSEGGAKVSDGVIREEMELARERIGELAELHGFDAEPVIGAVSEETLRDLNSQASGWWSTLLREGKPGEPLQWDAEEVEKAIVPDSLQNPEENPAEAEYLKSSTAEEVRNSITRMVLPMRQQTIRLGMQEIGKRVDLPSLVSFFLGVPWAVLALCALLAGLIALLDGRKFHAALTFIGSAFGAAALVLAALVLLFMNAGIQQMIGEASAGLAIQYRSVISGSAVLAGILAAALAAGCILCLAFSRKGGKTA